MNRFEKKCFIGSGALHGLLIVAFVFGSAFLNSPPKDMGPVVTMIADVGTSNAGGGSPNNLPPGPPPPPPQQEKVQQPFVKPEPLDPPKREEVRPEPVKKHVEPDIPKDKDKTPLPVRPKDAAKENTKPKSQISTTVIKRPNSNAVDKAAMQLAQAQRERDARAAREAKAQHDRAISEITGVINNVGSGLSRSTVTSPGIGDGTASGVATGRYGDALKAIYDAKWVLNTDLYNDEPATTVKVVVRRDGTVVSAVITKPSGNASFDRSVRATLNAVTRVLPFPPDMKELEQEFTWRFERKTRVG